MGLKDRAGLRKGCPRCLPAGRAAVIGLLTWVILFFAVPLPLTCADSGQFPGMDPETLESRIRVINDPERSELIVEMGPFSLPDSGNTMRVTHTEPIIVPVSGRLTSFSAKVVDTDGRELPQEILHHINIVDPGRRELFMPVMQRIVAAGHETGKISVPFPFGVPVSAGDTLLIYTMVWNPTGKPQVARIEARLQYEPDGGLNRFNVQPFYMDIRTPPASADFDLPPGRSTFTWEGSPAINVRLLGIGGHLHKYGTELRLEELVPGRQPKVLWRTQPVVSSDGEIVKIPRETFLLRLGLKMDANRTYRMVAVYDNPTGQEIPAGGMAEIAGVVWPLGKWPDSDPGNPQFQSDCQHFLRSDPGLRERFCH